MNIRFLRFDQSPTKTEDPDDYVFDASDYAFRLMALIMKSEITKNPNGLDDFVKLNGFTKLFK